MIRFSFYISKKTIFNYYSPNGIKSHSFERMLLIIWRSYSTMMDLVLTPNRIVSKYEDTVAY